MLLSSYFGPTNNISDNYLNTDHTNCLKPHKKHYFSDLTEK